MARVRDAALMGPSPEQHLQKAVGARSPATRAKYARLGLASRMPLDRTTHAMLLRQLYLAHFEVRQFAKAAEAAEQMVSLGILSDVAHQDAARALQALGQYDDAAGHLRLAARTSPANRRAFHLWTLGSLYYLRGQHVQAVGALSRASRWGTTDKPLYIGHLALARCALGQSTTLEAIIDQLANAPCGQGYGRFILGRLCCYAGRHEEATRYLEAFIQRTTSGRIALGIALEGEVSEAQTALELMRKNRWME